VIRVSIATPSAIPVSFGTFRHMLSTERGLLGIFTPKVKV
jgi:hypothetical protein